jgi:hypothetical protein
VAHGALPVLAAGAVVVLVPRPARRHVVVHVLQRHLAAALRRLLRAERELDDLLVREIRLLLWPRRRLRSSRNGRPVGSARGCRRGRHSCCAGGRDRPRDGTICRCSWRPDWARRGGLSRDRRTSRDPRGAGWLSIGRRRPRRTSDRPCRAQRPLHACRLSAGDHWPGCRRTRNSAWSCQRLSRPRPSSLHRDAPRRAQHC